MSTKLILIVHGEPNSTFSKYYLNILNQKSLKQIKKIVMIGSYNLLQNNEIT